MTKLLQEAFERAQALPEDDQDAIARQLLDEIASEVRWAALFAASGDMLERLGREAVAEHRAGLTE